MVPLALVLACHASGGRDHASAGLRCPRWAPARAGGRAHDDGRARDGGGMRGRFFIAPTDVPADRSESVSPARTRKGPTRGPGLLPIPGKGASIASDRYHDSMTHNLSSWTNRLWNDLKKPTSLPRRPSHPHRRPSRTHLRRTRGWVNICSARGRHCWYLRNQGRLLPHRHAANQRFREYHHRRVPLPTSPAPPKRQAES